MSIKANDVVNVMRGWIGADKRKIIDIYNSHKPLAQGYKVKYTDSWCDATVSACFIKLNAVDLIGGTECGVERHIQLFKAKGIWQEDGNVTPTAGAIICYNWDDSTQPNDGFADHIGIVEEVNGSQITVIEGNYNEAVRRRTIPVGWGYIRGYAFPKYSGSEAKPTTTQTVTKVSNNTMKYNDTNKPLVCMMTQSTCYNGADLMIPKGVLWHCTGCNNPNLWRYVQPSNNDPNKAELLNKIGKNNFGSDWNHATVRAGVNAWIGKLANGEVTAVQALPWNFAPWGCGGAANNTHIQFEMCEDNLVDKAYFEKCYKEGVELTAYLCKLYNIDPYGYIWLSGRKVPTILCHYDSYLLGVGTGHYDVYNWFNRYGKTMEDVRDDVAALISGAKPTTDNEPSNPVNSVGLKYHSHCQTYGNLPEVHDGQWSGTKGKSKRLEALWINPPQGVELEVAVHLQGIGWKEPIKIANGNNAIIGTMGESRRLECIKIKCTKNNTGKKLKYQAHCQTYGDTEICSEGQACGTTGQSKRLEAIRIWFE